MEFYLDETTLLASSRFSSSGGVSGRSLLLVSSGSVPGLALAANFCVSWNSVAAGTEVDAGNPGNADVFLRRDAAGVLAQRDGVNAQSHRTYYTFTDLLNRQNAAINTGADYVEIAAETAGTGADNLDVRLTPAGTGNVRFGTHAAIGIKVTTGYITIKDSGGNLRDIAVVS